MSYFECRKCGGTFDPSLRWCPVCDQVTVEHTEELRRFNDSIAKIATTSPKPDSGPNPNDGTFGLPLEYQRSEAATQQASDTKGTGKQSSNHPNAEALADELDITDAEAERFCVAVNWHPDGTENKIVEGQFHTQQPASAR